MERAADLGYERGLVFVIMAFSPAMTRIYKAIAEECRKLRLHTRRADELTGASPILDDIIDGIIDAEFIICDLTEERPNVYYELGYSHGVGNEPMDIFLIARAGTKPHFDVQGLRIQFYDSPRHLREILSTRFANQVRERRKSA